MKTQGGKSSRQMFSAGNAVVCSSFTDNGYFELVLESREIFSITADINISGIIRDILFHLETVCGMYSLDSTEYTQHTFTLKKIEKMTIL